MVEFGRLSEHGGGLVNSLLAALLASALIFIQCYISGTRLAFSLPALTLIAIAGILSFFAPRPRGTSANRWCLGVTAVFFGYILIRAWLSPVPYLARNDIFTLLGCLITYGLCALYLTESSTRSAILASLFLLTAVEVIIGTRQFMYQDNWMPFGLVRGSTPDASRASGTFISSIHLAGFLEIVAPFALGVAFWGARKLWIRLFAGYLAVVCYFGIGITGSRGGWISSLFSLLIFLILSLDLIRRTHRSWFAPALYLSVIAVLAVPTGAFFLLQKDGMLSKRVDLLSQIVQRDVKTYDIRIHNWTAALEQWKESKWTGTGAGTHLYYGRKHRQPAVQQDPQHAHSDYLELLAEYGLIGAGGLMVFLFVHLRSGLRGYRILAQRRAEDPYRASPQLALNLGALGAFAAYFIHSAVDFNLHLPGNALVFASIFGILAHPVALKATLARDEEAEQDPRHLTARWPWSLRLVLPAFGVILILIGTRTFPEESLSEKARVSLRTGNFNEAIALSQRALAREKNNPYLYYYLGNAHFSRAQLAPKNARRPDLEAAENAYRAGLALFPQDETPWVRLGQVLDELGRHEEAQTAFETAISLDPKAGILYAYLGEHFRKIGDPEREKETLARGQTLINFDIGLYFYNASKPRTDP